jgi:cation diffusion facilitator CzcD-associated flavoprotein CzcO
MAIGEHTAQPQTAPRPQDGSLLTAGPLTGDVLVIGAGPAGLAAAWALEKARIPYSIIERADHIAPTWAGLYPSLRLNTAGFVSYLPGKRMPLRYGIYPMGTQLTEYLRAYAADMRIPVRFGLEAVRISPEMRGGVPGWSVAVRDVQDARSTLPETVWFPFVISAMGRFSKPYLPPIPGRDQFTGRLLHAHAYHGPAPFAGARVLVAGSGPSGTDIALELARSGAGLPVLLSVRSDIVIARRYPYGLPDSAWHLIARALVPARWRKRFLDRVLYQGYGDTDGLGLTLAPNRTDRRGTSAPIRGHDLIDAIRAGRIVPVPGIAAFTADRVVTADGEAHAVDAAILSTGYRPAIDLYDFPFMTDRDGWPRRWSSTIEGGSTEVRAGTPTQPLPDAVGLYLVGRFYRGLGPLHNIREEALGAVREIAARRLGRR